MISKGQPETVHGGAYVQLQQELADKMQALCCESLPWTVHDILKARLAFA